VKERILEVLADGPLPVGDVMDRVIGRVEDGTSVGVRIEIWKPIHELMAEGRVWDNAGAGPAAQDVVGLMEATE
jgi:hypothetical protein